MEAKQKGDDANIVGKQLQQRKTSPYCGHECPETPGLYFGPCFKLVHNY